MNRGVRSPYYKTALLARSKGAQLAEKIGYDSDGHNGLFLENLASFRFRQNPRNEHANPVDDFMNAGCEEIMYVLDKPLHDVPK